MKLKELIQITKIKEAVFSSEYERSLELLSVYHDIDTEELEDKPLSWMHKELSQLNNELTKEYTPINPRKRNKITLANFIDCERYLKTAEDMPKALAVLMLDEIEDITEDSKQFEEMDISECLGNLIVYREFRKEILDTYKSIFEDSQPEPIDLTGLTQQEIKEVQEAELKESQKEQYSWEMFVYWLADNRIVDIERVLEFPVIYALNMASMKKIISE